MFQKKKIFFAHQHLNGSTWNMNERIKKKNFKVFESGKIIINATIDVKLQLLL